MNIPRDIDRLPTYWFEFIRTGLFSLIIAGLCLACGQDAGAEQRQGEVRSIFEGEITLSAEVDTSLNYSDFEVLVAERTELGIDTLGFAKTDAEGKFFMQITAPKTNIYTLVISRSGKVLKVGEIAVAEGDSASVKVKFPFGQRPIMIRSVENAALLGFKNTVALHNTEIDKMSNEGIQDQTVFANKISQTSEILWGLQKSSPGTLAASLAAAQSIEMLEGWNDSLAVARAKEVDPSNVNYGSIVGAARRAQVRIAGAEGGPALVEALKTRVTDEDILAVVQSELVMAYRDNKDDEKALAAARALKMQYATDSSWIRWADRAIFDLEKLRAGMMAPDFNLVDNAGKTVTRGSFAGKYLVIEFYRPGPEFEAELLPRNAFYRADEETAAFEILSISLEGDPVMNEAFFDGRDLPGRHVFLKDGANAKVIKSYNVFLLPTRFLIDPEGKIVGKYVLNNGLNVFKDALVLSQSSDAGE